MYNLLFYEIRLLAMTFFIEIFTDIRLLLMKSGTILEWIMILVQEVHLIKGIHPKENYAPELADIWITNRTQTSGHLAAWKIIARIIQQPVHGVLPHVRESSSVYFHAHSTKD